MYATMLNENDQYLPLTGLNLACPVPVCWPAAPNPPKLAPVVVFWPIFSCINNFHIER